MFIVFLLVSLFALAHVLLLNGYLYCYLYCCTYWDDSDDNDEAIMMLGDGHCTCRAHAACAAHSAHEACAACALEPTFHSRMVTQVKKDWPEATEVGPGTGSYRGLGWGEVRMRLVKASWQV